MANTFTTSRAVVVGGMHGKDLVRKYGILAIDTTASGGAAKGDLPAATFGLTYIEASGVACNDDESKVYPTTPCYDRTSLMVGDGVSSAPQDLPNDNYRIWVEGV